MLLGLDSINVKEVRIERELATPLQGGRNTELDGTLKSQTCFSLPFHRLQFPSD